MPKPPVLDKKTLLPVGIVVCLLGVVVTCTQDRERTISRVESVERQVHEHDKRMAALEGDVRYVREALIRLESKFGTLP